MEHAIALSKSPFVDVAEYGLRFSRELFAGEATQLRGYFGNRFADELLLHHHHTDGTLHYNYPRVQFKVIDRMARLIGIAEGGEVVQRLWQEVDEARLRGEVLPVLEGTLRRRRERFGEAAGPVEYQFQTPWLALNQENYRRYERASVAERNDILGRVLVGNCLAVAKSFGVYITAQLTADVSRLRPRSCRFKGVPLLGFVGRFRVNFHLPAWLGIGKSVSRGFGTVEPLLAGEQL